MATGDPTEPGELFSSQTQETRVIQVNGKYRVQIERAASTKGTDGFKVEVNGDELDKVTAECEALLLWAKSVTAKGGE